MPWLGKDTMVVGVRLLLISSKTDQMNKQKWGSASACQSSALRPLVALLSLLHLLEG